MSCSRTSVSLLRRSWRDTGRGPLIDRREHPGWTRRGRLIADLRLDQTTARERLQLAACQRPRTRGQRLLRFTRRAANKHLTAGLHGAGNRPRRLPTTRWRQRLKRSDLDHQAKRRAPDARSSEQVLHHVVHSRPGKPLPAQRDRRGRHVECRDAVATPGELLRVITQTTSDDQTRGAAASWLTIQPCHQRPVSRQRRPRNRTEVRPGAGIDLFKPSLAGYLALISAHPLNGREDVASSDTMLTRCRLGARTP